MKNIRKHKVIILIISSALIIVASVYVVAILLATQTASRSYNGIGQISGFRYTIKEAPGKVVPLGSTNFYIDVTKDSKPVKEANLKFVVSVFCSGIGGDFACTSATFSTKTDNQGRAAFTYHGDPFFSLFPNREHTLQVFLPPNNGLINLDSQIYFNN